MNNKQEIVSVPKGYEEKKSKDHISLYLVMVNTAYFPLGWEVDVVFKFLLFDHTKDKYVTVEGGLDGTFKIFHESKTEWGFSNLIPLGTFYVPRNDYLVNVTCIFGAEIFVSKCLAYNECLNVMNDDPTAKFTWKVEHFSQSQKQNLLKSDGMYSCQEITNGYKQRYMRLYLFLYGKDSPVQYKRVYAMSMLCIREQNGGTQLEYEGEVPS